MERNKGTQDRDTGYTASSRQAEVLAQVEAIVGPKGIALLLTPDTDPYIEALNAHRAQLDYEREQRYRRGRFDCCWVQPEFSRKATTNTPTAKNRRIKKQPSSPPVKAQPVERRVTYVPGQY
jgi:hypothetical protein